MKIIKKTQLFRTDWKHEVELIYKNLNKNVFDYLKKDGVVIGLSGGIDSSVTAALCVKALGKDKVYGVLLPEQESNSNSVKFGKLIAEHLGINYEIKNISSSLEAFGVYDTLTRVIKKNFEKYTPAIHTYKISLPQNLLESNILNLYSLIVEDKEGNILYKSRLSFSDYKLFQAALSIKLRTRMVNLYFCAEQRNFAVLGTTNRSEFDLGNFCKFGDGGVDAEVISHLYKTEVYQLAKYLNIPLEIQQRKPSPDICSGYVTDQEFFFSLPFDILDSLLYYFNKEETTKKVAEKLQMDIEIVERVFNNFKGKQNNTKHLKMLPPVCGVN